MDQTDLNFKISTTAELTALHELERELTKSIAAARALGKGEDVAKFGSQLAQVKARIGEFNPFQRLGAEALGAASEIPVLGRVMTALNGSLGPVSVAITAVTTALAVASKAVSAYAEQETDIVKLNQALANSGQFSEEASAAVQELAAKYKELTGIDDSRFLGAFRTLIQFGANTGDLEKYAEAVTNLAGIMGGDIEGAANLFGKALQGNTEVLGRYGIKVDAAASQTQKLDSIMAQAASRGAGQLTAGSETLARRFGDLKLGIDDAWKGLGNLISRTGVVQFGLDAMRGGLLVLNRMLPQTAEVAGDFSNKLELVGDSAEEAAKKLDQATKAGEALAGIDLKELEQKTAAAAAKFAALTSQIRAAEQAQIAMTDAKLARDLALVDAKEAGGGMSATDAAKARYDLKQSAEEEKTRLQLESIARQKQEQQARVSLADADVARREGRIDDLSKAGAGAQDTANSAARDLNNNTIDHRQNGEKNQADIETLRQRLRDALKNNVVGSAGDDGTAGRLLKEINDRVAAQKTGDVSFGEQQKRLADLTAKAKAQVEQIKAELEKLKPELEKARLEADKTRKDAQGQTGLLDIQESSVRATAPVKRETAAMQQESVIRDAAAKDKKRQEDDDNAAVRDAALGTAGTYADRARSGVNKVGADAKKSGDSALLEAARKAREAIDATRDGTTAEEAKAAVEALTALADALKAKDQESAALRTLVGRLAAQVKVIASTQSTGRSLD